MKFKLDENLDQLLDVIIVIYVGENFIQYLYHQKLSHNCALAAQIVEEIRQTSQHHHIQVFGHEKFQRRHKRAHERDRVCFYKYVKKRIQTAQQFQVDKFLVLFGRHIGD